MNALDNAGDQRLARAGQLAERKDEMESQVTDLQRQIEGIANEARRDDRQAARQLDEAAGSISDNRVREKIRYTRNTLDLNAIPVIKKLSHLPIIVDPSHGIGMWDGVAAMALAGIAAGADGLMIEVHPNPEAALSDGAQSLKPDRFRELMERVRLVAAAVERTVSLEVEG